ncbi:hypothetical protein HYH03_006861 [Edaphochlamys debaryana]|uniref:Uncharacterized protein n=1 Tax=Edaphochlamys debaryana TaxID=47281 RepID=A0A835Y2U8_9CHLO|nr:hypothetical protein HYH03_006861 [Edaphochlamys debaryana]|eukprot:KAG2494926.1 hypothetical protein HYH03_006861 [Edaphochlamys debaryana]
MGPVIAGDEAELLSTVLRGLASPGSRDGVPADIRELPVRRLRPGFGAHVALARVAALALLLLSCGSSGPLATPWARVGPGSFLRAGQPAQLADEVSAAVAALRVLVVASTGSLLLINGLVALQSSALFRRHCCLCNTVVTVICAAGHLLITCLNLLGRPPAPAATSSCVWAKAAIGSAACVPWTDPTVSGLWAALCLHSALAVNLVGNADSAGPFSAQLLAALAMAAAAGGTAGTGPGGGLLAQLAGVQGSGAGASGLAWAVGLAPHLLVTALAAALWLWCCRQGRYVVSCGRFLAVHLPPEYGTDAVLLLPLWPDSPLGSTHRTGAAHHGGASVPGFDPGSSAGCESGADVVPVLLAAPPKRRQLGGAHTLMRAVGSIQLAGLEVAGPTSARLWGPRRLSTQAVLAQAATRLAAIDLQHRARQAAAAPALVLPLRQLLPPQRQQPGPATAAPLRPQQPHPPRDISATWPHERFLLRCAPQFSLRRSVSCSRLERTAYGRMRAEQEQRAVDEQAHASQAGATASPTASEVPTTTGIRRSLGKAPSSAARALAQPISGPGSHAAGVLSGAAALVSATTLVVQGAGLPAAARAAFLSSGGATSEMAPSASMPSRALHGSNDPVVQLLGRGMPSASTRSGRGSADRLPSGIVLSGGVPSGPGGAASSVTPSFPTTSGAASDGPDAEAVASMVALLRMWNPNANASATATAAVHAPVVEAAAISFGPAERSNLSLDTLFAQATPTTSASPPPPGSTASGSVLMVSPFHTPHVALEPLSPRSPSPQPEVISRAARVALDHLQQAGPQHAQHAAWPAPHQQAQRAQAALAQARAPSAPPANQAQAQAHSQPLPQASAPGVHSLHEQHGEGQRGHASVPLQQVHQGAFMTSADVLLHRSSYAVHRGGRTGGPGHADRFQGYPGSHEPAPVGPAVSGRGRYAVSHHEGAAPLGPDNASPGSCYAASGSHLGPPSPQSLRSLSSGMESSRQGQSHSTDPLHKLQQQSFGYAPWELLATAPSLGILCTPPGSVTGHLSALQHMGLSPYGQAQAQPDPQGWSVMQRLGAQQPGTGTVAAVLGPAGNLRPRGSAEAPQLQAQPGPPQPQTQAQTQAQASGHAQGAARAFLTHQAGPGPRAPHRTGVRNEDLFETIGSYTSGGASRPGASAMSSYMDALEAQGSSLDPLVELELASVDEADVISGRVAIVFRSPGAPSGHSPQSLQWPSPGGAAPAPPPRPRHVRPHPQAPHGSAHGSSTTQGSTGSMAPYGSVSSPYGTYGRAAHTLASSGSVSSSRLSPTNLVPPNASSLPSGGSTASAITARSTTLAAAVAAQIPTLPLLIPPVWSSSASSAQFVSTALWDDSSGAAGSETPWLSMPAGGDVWMDAGLGADECHVGTLGAPLGAGGGMESPSLGPVGGRSYGRYALRADPSSPSLGATQPGWLQPADRALSVAGVEDLPPRATDTSANGNQAGPAQPTTTESGRPPTPRTGGLASSTPNSAPQVSVKEPSPVRPWTARGSWPLGLVSSSSAGASGGARAGRSRPYPRPTGGEASGTASSSTASSAVRDGAAALVSAAVTVFGDTLAVPGVECFSAEHDAPPVDPGARSWQGFWVEASAEGSGEQQR